MTGIAELFAELSEPDYYDVSAQLELWAWQYTGGRREEWRDRKRMTKRRKQVHRCGVCGGEGHRGWWRGAVICMNAAARAA